MAMPIKLIYNIKISVKQKAGLVCVFSLCLVMIVFAVTRAKQILTEDYFVNLTLLEIWSTLESAICKHVYSIPYRLTCSIGALQSLSELVTKTTSSCDSRLSSRFQDAHLQPRCYAT